MVGGQLLVAVVQQHVGNVQQDGQDVAVEPVRHHHAPFLQDAQSVLHDVDSLHQGVVAGDGGHLEPVPHVHRHVGGEEGGGGLAVTGPLRVRAFLPDDVIIGKGVPADATVLKSHVRGEKEASPVVEEPLCYAQGQPVSEQDGQVSIAAVQLAREVKVSLSRSHVNALRKEDKRVIAERLESLHPADVFCGVAEYVTASVQHDDHLVLGVPLGDLHGRVVIPVSTLGCGDVEEQLDAHALQQDHLPDTQRRVAFVLVGSQLQQKGVLLSSVQIPEQEGVDSLRFLGHLLAGRQIRGQAIRVEGCGQQVLPCQELLDLPKGLPFRLEVYVVSY